MNIVYLSSEDMIGRRFNGYDLASYYNRLGHQARLYVWRRQSQEPWVRQLYASENQKLRDLVRKPGLIMDSLLGLPGLGYPPMLFGRRDFAQADVIHLQLVGDYFFNWLELIPITQRKPTILTLHDRSFFTSHCVHPPRECEQWKAACVDCQHRERFFPLTRKTERLIWHLKKRIYARCDLELVVASGWMLRQVQASPLLGLFKTHLVPFGVDLNIFRPPDDREALRRELGIDAGSKVVFLRAMDTEYKNFDVIYRALEALEPSGPVCLLSVSNEGYLDGLKQKYQIIDRGFITSQGEMAKLFGAADIFIMPSFCESFGMMAVEAMACGVPSIVTQGTALEEVAFAPRASVVVPNRDVAALVAAIQDLLQNDNWRKQLGAEARKLAVQHYDFGQHAQRLLRVYQEGIAARKGTRASNMNHGNLPASAPEKPPLVSIIMPVYNGSDYLGEAIDSALAQTYKNFEVIVVNDGSDDQGATDRICAGYGEAIRYYRKENGGVSSALNLGIRQARGEYIAWLSHDDLFFPEKLQAQVEELHQLSDKKVVLYSDYELINKRGAPMGQVRMGPIVYQKPYYSLLRGALNGCTILVPRGLFDEIGFFDESLPSTQDYHLWYRALGKYRFHHMPQILVKTRQHDKQGSKVMPKHQLDSERLWIWMIRKTPEAVKIELEGNLIAFYSRMADFLERSGFTHAKDYCARKANRLIAQQIKVSVIIPFYDRVELVLRAMASILMQTHQNFEVWLVDDGSREDVSRIQNICRSDSRLHYIRQSHQGVSAARNQGLDAATGEFVAFLDSDDSWVRDKLSIQLSEMLRHNWSCSFHSYFRVKGGHSEVRRYRRKRSAVDSLVIATPTVMISKKLITKEFRFSTEFWPGEDVILWIKAAQANTWHLIEQPLAMVHVSDQSTSSDPNKQLAGVRNIFQYVCSMPESEDNLCLQYELAKSMQYLLRRQLMRFKGGTPDNSFGHVNRHQGLQYFMNQPIVNLLYTKLPVGIRRRVKSALGVWP